MLKAIPGANCSFNLRHIFITVSVISLVELCARKQEVTSLTFPGREDGVAAKVGDLHHHAIVHHAVGGFQPAVNADVTGEQVRHALAKQMRR